MNEKAGAGLSRASKGREKSDLDRYRDSANEAEVQKSIVEGLEWLGYVVFQTNEHRHRPTCEHKSKGYPRCGGALVCSVCARTATYSHQGSGSDRGVPDLIVTRAKEPGPWPAYCWLGLEVKTATGALSVAQDELDKADRIAVVRSFDEAREAVEAVERGMGLR